MENILPRRLSKAVKLLLLGVVTTCVLLTPVLAQDEVSLPPEKVGEYQDYLAKGEQLLGQSKYEEAIAQFNRALLINPNSEEAKRGIIVANQRIAARSETPDMATIEKERLEFHLTKGTEYYDAEKYDEAIAEWNQVLRLDPEHKLARSLIEAGKRAKVDWLVEKGHDDFFAGNLDEAIAIWEEALEIVPSSSVLMDLLAEAREARHVLETRKTDAEHDTDVYRVDEYIQKMGLLPEGASPDGIKRKDLSEKPRPREPRGFGAREAIMKELSQPVAFEFECEPLRDVLRFLTTITGINILVDEEIFEEFGETEDCYGNEVDREEIFVTIHVSELPLESALSGMLRQHGLGFSIERDFLYVSTPGELRGSSFEQLETRFYHLKDTSRLSLPKLDTTGAASKVSLGGRSLDLTSSQSIISRSQKIQGDQINELEGDYVSMSVPKLVNILRTFVPTVLDPSKTEQKRADRVSEDKQYGGLRKTAEQIDLFETPRVLWADGSGREILSLIDFDPHTNTLIVRNTPTNLDMVEVFLDHLDKDPRQISVEAKFITYSLFEAKRAGIDFTFGGTSGIGEGEDAVDANTAQFDSDTISDGALTNLRMDSNIANELAALFGLDPLRGGDILFRFTKADGDFLALTINLLEELKNTQTISAPRLVTLNNKPAIIQDVLQRSFRTNLTIETNIVAVEGTDTSTTQSIEQEFTEITEGITLSITPQIQPDDTIRLFVLPEVSNITSVDEFDTQSASEDQVVTNTVTRPQITRQSLFTNVVVDDGDTIVVGGLIQEERGYQQTGVPFFKDIPLVGRLFDNETKISDRTNLLIFITVNIMNARGVAYTRLK